MLIFLWTDYRTNNNLMIACTGASDTVMEAAGRNNEGLSFMLNMKDNPFCLQLHAVQKHSVQARII